MVGLRSPLSFWRDDRGVSLTEGLITIPIVLLVFATFVEFGYAMSQWNQTVKALQYGARLAAVSDPLVDMDDFTDVFPTEADDPLNNGDATPNDSTISSSCGATRTACELQRALSRVVLGSDGACDGRAIQTGHLRSQLAYPAGEPGGHLSAFGARLLGAAGWAGADHAAGSPRYYI